MCLVGAVGRGQIFQLIHDAPGLGFNPAVMQSRNVGFEVAGDGPFIKKEKKESYEISCISDEIFLSRHLYYLCYIYLL